MSDRTAVLVNPWQIHSYPHTRELPVSRILALYIEPTWLAGVDATFGAEHPPFSQPCIELTAPVRRLFRDVADAAMGHVVLASQQEELLAALLCEVIVRFARGRMPARQDHQAAAARIQRAVDFMIAESHRPLTMERAAREAALSRAHFFELFKARTGMSPLVFHHAMRMEASYRALLQSTANLRQVAISLRFSDAAHFSRFFRDHVGVPPSEYRHAIVNADLNLTHFPAWSPR